MLPKTNYTSETKCLAVYSMGNQKVRASTRNALQYLIWLKSQTVKIYLVVQSVKLLLVLSIYENGLNNMSGQSLLIL